MPTVTENSKKIEENQNLELNNNFQAGEGMCNVINNKENQQW